MHFELTHLVHKQCLLSNPQHLISTAHACTYPVFWVIGQFRMIFDGHIEIYDNFSLGLIVPGDLQRENKYSEVQHSFKRNPKLQWFCFNTFCGLSWKKLCCLLNQLNAKVESITTWSFKISFFPPGVLISSFGFFSWVWLAVVSTFIMYISPLSMTIFSKQK